MKTENLNRAKNLLDKYELGQTSLEEENVLITYFNSEEVPNELANYKDEFNYYSAFRNVQFTGSLQEPNNISGNSLVKKIYKFFSKWYVLSLIILVPILLLIATYQNNQNEEVKPINNQSFPPPSTNDSISLVNQDSKFKDSFVRENKNSSTYPIVSSTQTAFDTLNNTIELGDKVSVTPESSTYNVSSKNNTIELGDKVSVTTESSTDNVSSDNQHNLLNSSTDKSGVAQKEVTFNLTENSTSGKLASIAYLANKAGIEYTYIVDRHKKKIHELNIEMIIRSTGERSQLWIAFPKKSSFVETLYWTVDQDGKAVSLCAGKIEHMVSAKHPIE